MLLLQFQIKDNNINIYFFSNTIEDNISLYITILIYSISSQSNLDENNPIEKTISVSKKDKKISGDREISKFIGDEILFHF